MRRLRRSGFVVPILAESGVGGRKKLEHRRNYEDPQKKQVPTEFEPYWINPQVRGLLHSMQGRVCAYCLTERPLDLEHFRPKTGYWWLAYEAENYLLGCTACNRDRKGTQFPLRTGAIRVTYDTRHTLPAEQRILLDPVADDVESCFALSNDASCQILPASHLAPVERERVQEVIDFFGLNLDLTVRKRRSQVYENAILAVNEGRWSDAQTMAMRHREQSFAARYALKQLAPERPLPSDEEEALDLTRMLWSDLKIDLAELRDLKWRGKTPRELDKRQKRTCCWALIVLQADPSAAHATAVQRLCADLLRQETERSKKEILTAFKIELRISRAAGRN